MTQKLQHPSLSKTPHILLSCSINKSEFHRVEEEKIRWEREPKKPTFTHQFFSTVQLATFIPLQQP
jgi:hypothetical protein